MGFVSTFVGFLIGGLLGLLSGYFGGKTDSAITKLMDIQLSFPLSVFAIFVVGIMGPNLMNVIVICGITRWVMFARVVRGEVLSVREKEFIEAARGIGCSTPRILLRHIFPNIISSVLVLATLNIGTIIVLESTLSFLGLGVQPPTPSWGNMLNDGKAYMVQAWWITALPGLAIMLVVLSANMIGDYLSDLVNPYAKQLMTTSKNKATTDDSWETRIAYSGIRESARPFSDVERNSQSRQRGRSHGSWKGETIGIVGESGCGKTMTGLSILRLIPRPAGRIARGRN